MSGNFFKRIFIGFMSIIIFYPQIVFAVEKKVDEKISPRLIFQEIFKNDVSGLGLAGLSGQVLVHSNEWVNYYDPSGRLLWKKTGYKYITGAGVSRDGKLVIFQTSPVPKTGQQTALDLTVHVLNGAGEELVNKPNPHRYFTSLLSPMGNFIVFGDPLFKRILVYDRSMNKLWERETYIWYVGFDPEEEFIYDSASGLLLNNEGRRVWELPSGGKFLGVSRGAEIILSQQFLTVKAKNQIFLTSRISIEQVVLEGYCAGVSYDGALVAFQDLAQQVLVWRTDELVRARKGEAGLNPILQSKSIHLVRNFYFSRDNKKLLIYGESAEQAGKVVLVDLVNGQKLWEKEWKNPLIKILVSDDLKYLLAESSPKTIENYGLE